MSVRAVQPQPKEEYRWLSSFYKFVKKASFSFFVFVQFLKAFIEFHSLVYFQFGHSLCDLLVYHIYCVNMSEKTLAFDQLGEFPWEQFVKADEGESLEAKIPENMVVGLETMVLKGKVYQIEYDHAIKSMEEKCEGKFRRTQFDTNKKKKLRFKQLVSAARKATVNCFISIVIVLKRLE